MKVVALFAFAALTIAIEPIVNVEAAGSAFRPDVPFVALFTMMARAPGPIAVLGGAAIGLVCDVLSEARLGAHVVLFATLAASGSVLIPRRRLAATEIFLLAFGYAWVAGMLTRLARMAAGGASIAAPTGASAMAGAAATAALVSVLWIGARFLGRNLNANARGRPGGAPMVWRNGSG